MSLERFQDLDESGESNFVGWHCLNCGAIVDPVIVVNRKQRPSVVNPTRPRH
jgi:hypothetical protein